MNLIDIVKRTATPLPWAEGEKIPWHDPTFSQRMLREHLSQAHDHASRRFAIIDQHVDWIHRHLLSAKPGNILDLGCGPGLYSSRLAKLGHTCTGIDFSPASIEYARNTAQAENLSCTYHLQDVRKADFGKGGYDLVMFIFGELNVFTPADAHLILQKAYDALHPGGQLLIEVHTFDYVRAIGEQPASWYAMSNGLYADAPYLCLTENFWNAECAVAIQRYYILHADSGKVTRYAASNQAYSDDQYRGLLKQCGFREVCFYPSLDGLTPQKDFVAIIAKR
jgi:SAM-dependent methyltransferase